MQNPKENKIAANKSAAKNFIALWILFRKHISIVATTQCTLLLFNLTSCFAHMKLSYPIQFFLFDSSMQNFLQITIDKNNKQRNDSLQMFAIVICRAVSPNARFSTSPLPLFLSLVSSSRTFDRVVIVFERRCQLV